MGDSVVDPRSDVMPLLAAKDRAAAAVFEPANLLREARRQRALADSRFPRWACSILMATSSATSPPAA